MIQKFKKYVFVAIASLTMLAPGLVPVMASALAAPTTTATITSDICSGSSLGSANNTCSTNGSTDSIKALAAKIISIFSILVGIVAVIMVIFGGFKYITSGGDSNSVSGAKNTLIYAIIGLIIVALAQFIVHFVLNTATSTGLTG